MALVLIAVFFHLSLFHNIVCKAISRKLPVTKFFLVIPAALILSVGGVLWFIYFLILRLMESIMEHKTR